MASQIDLYQDMATLSAAMVEAARAHDWNRLVVLEKSVSALRNRLMDNDDNSSLSDGERSQKAAMIQRILDDDAEIRRHTEPWMEQVRHFLGGPAMRAHRPAVSRISQSRRRWP